MCRNSHGCRWTSYSHKMPRATVITTAVAAAKAKVTGLAIVEAGNQSNKRHPKHNNSSISHGLAL